MFVGTSRGRASSTKSRWTRVRSPRRRSNADNLSSSTSTTSICTTNWFWMCELLLHMLLVFCLLNVFPEDFCRLYRPGVVLCFSCVIVVFLSQCLCPGMPMACSHLRAVFWRRPTKNLLVSFSTTIGSFYLRCSTYFPIHNDSQTLLCACDFTRTMRMASLHSTSPEFQCNHTHSELRIHSALVLRVLCELARVYLCIDIYRGECRSFGVQFPPYQRVRFFGLVFCLLAHRSFSGESWRTLIVGLSC